MPTRAAQPDDETRYFLMKSEPDVFSFDDLWASPRRRTEWTGVRNYQARNTMRDEARVGDLVLFYHSNASPPGVAGIARITRTGVVDPTQFDDGSEYHDPKSTPTAPRWICVEIEAVRRLRRFVPLDHIRAEESLSDMPLVQRGTRLSVFRVAAAHWDAILALGEG